MDMDRSTLIVKNLPPILTEIHVKDILSKFGASSVRYMGNFGKMRNTAYATFRSPNQAQHALIQLHQLKILNFVLRVEYANAKQSSAIKDTNKSSKCRYNDPLARTQNNAKESAVVNVTDRSSNDDINSHDITKNLEICRSKINYMSKLWDVPYNFDEGVSYGYPPPSNTTLTNIIHCMASVPKFYVQVLNLMNKMHLPPPFGELTTSPPIKQDASGTRIVDQLTSSESELESSEDNAKPKTDERKKQVLTKKRTKKLPQDIYAKRLRLQLKLTSTAPAVKDDKAAATRPTSIQDVFEVAREQAKMVKVSLPAQVALTNTEEINVDNFTGSPSQSFGKISSIAVDVAADFTEGMKASVESSGVHKQAEEQDDIVEQTTPYITARELRDGRVAEHDGDNHPILKKYTAGEPCERLYVKNLAKQTSSDELKYIFGRYVDWNDEVEAETFNVRHMTEGRMKGQAFISLPTIDAAQAAVSECHTYMLHGKPMVVAYAKSKT